MKVSWTPEAKRTFYNILDYFEQRWGDKEISAFVEKTTSVISQIQQNPKMFKKSKYKKIQIGFITKQTSLFYRVKKHEIELLSFWDNRQNPKKQTINNPQLPCQLQ